MPPCTPSIGQLVWPQAASAHQQQQMPSAQHISYITQHFQQQLQQHHQCVSGRPFLTFSTRPRQTHQQQIFTSPIRREESSPRSLSISTQIHPVQSVNSTVGYSQQQQQRLHCPSAAKIPTVWATSEPPLYKYAFPPAYSFVRADPPSQQESISLPQAVPCSSGSVYRWPIPHSRGRTAYEWSCEAGRRFTPAAAGEFSSNIGRISTAVASSVTTAHANRRKNAASEGTLVGPRTANVAVAPGVALAADNVAVAPGVAAAANVAAAAGVAAPARSVEGAIQKQNHPIRGAAATPGAAAANVTPAGGVTAGALVSNEERGRAVSQGGQQVAKLAVHRTGAAGSAEEAASAALSTPTKQLGIQATACAAKSVGYRAKLMELTEPLAPSRGFPCETPTPLCATPPTLAAVGGAPLHSFAVSTDHGTVLPTERTATSLGMPFHLLSAHVSPAAPQAETAAGVGTRLAAAEPAVAGVRTAAGIRTVVGVGTAANVRAAAGGGGSASVVVKGPWMPQHQDDGVQKTAIMHSRLVQQQSRQPQNLQFFSHMKQQQGRLLLPHPAATERLSFSTAQPQQRQLRIPLEAARPQPTSAWQQQMSRKKGMYGSNKQHENNSTAASILGHDEDGQTVDSEIINGDTYYEACCSRLWGTSPTHLFSLDITATCKTHPITGIQAAMGAAQQERKRLAFGNALKELLGAEREAKTLVDAAKEIAARRRSRVLSEVETAQVSCRASHEEDWKEKKKKFEEEGDAMRAQLENLVETQLDIAMQGLPERQSKAADFIIKKVLEVDTRCPLEAVKRFASPRRQLAFYKARMSQKEQVVHHPPGDRLRMEKDVIIWDDEGYAKVEHISADKKMSVTQLGSFWVRHQAKVKQHSDRPLVLLSTQRLPGGSADEAYKDEHVEGEEAGQAPRFPPLRSLSEVHSLPRSRSSRAGVSLPATKAQDSGEIEKLPAKLKEDLEDFARSAEPSKKTEKGK